MMDKVSEWEDITLEEGFEQLDRIIERLDGEEGSLEAAFKDYEKGIKLLNACRKKLDTVEKKVMALSAEGEYSEFEEE